MVVSLALKVKVVSSAYITVFAVPKQFGKSLIKSRKNRDPSHLIEPCGMPHLTDLFVHRRPRLEVSKSSSLILNF